VVFDGIVAVVVGISVVIVVDNSGVVVDISVDVECVVLFTFRSAYNINTI